MWTDVSFRPGALNQLEHLQQALLQPSRFGIFFQLSVKFPETPLIKAKHLAPNRAKVCGSALHVCVCCSAQT